jgi:hypothetical protein
MATEANEISLVESWPSYQWQLEATDAFYHQWQTGIRNFVYVISRQYGKTSLLKAITLKEARRVPDTYWYVAPSYDRSEEVYVECCDALGDLIEERLVSPKQSKAGWVIRFNKALTGGRPAALHFKSLGNPEMLRGATLRGLVVDEAGLVEGRVFRKILMPMLRVKDAWCILSGTPPEDDESPDPEFFRSCEKRAKSDDPRWWGIHRDYTTIPDPRIVADIESDRPFMTEDEFAREYLALFPDLEEYRLPPLLPWGPNSTVKTHPDDLQVFTGVDLADNEQEMGDKASVVTWGVAPGGDVFILAAEYYKNPSEVLDALYLHQSMFRMVAVKLQRVGFDKGFRYTIEQAEIGGRGFLPVDMIDLGGASKRRRIMQMEPLARASRLYVREDLREFFLEWEQFPDGLKLNRGRMHRSNHYDMLDAASGCVMDSNNALGWNAPVAPKRSTFEDAKKFIKARRRGVTGDKLNRIFQIR